MRRLLLFAVLGLLVASGAAAEEIGSWVLSCPSPASCVLRHRSWLLAPGTGGPSVALEVVRRGGRFVPVVALRGLSPQVALAGALTLRSDVSLRFDGASAIELPCGPDGGAVVCAPSVDAADGAAAELAASRGVLVQVRLSVPGGPAVPEQSRSLELVGTAEAVARFRAAAPADEAAPAVAGLDLRGLLDRFARDAGFRNGLADLLPNVAGWVGGRR